MPSKVSGNSRQLYRVEPALLAIGVARFCAIASTPASAAIFASRATAHDCQPQSQLTVGRIIVEAVGIMEVWRPRAGHGFREWHLSAIR